MKRIICSVLVTVIILTLLPIAVSAGGYAGVNITWDFKDGTLTFDGSGEIIDYEEGRSPWLRYRTDIRSVVIPEGITALGAYAFADCRNLSSVTLPESLTLIGDGAFLRCYSLTRISIPDAVTSIGNDAFSDCWQLATVSIARWNSLLVSIGDGAFSLCTSLSRITLPGDLEVIGDSAFRSCISLNGIILPDSLRSIGSFAFESCTSLGSIELPYRVTSIPDFAFFYCKSLTDVRLGRYTREIGREAFMRCDSLMRLIVPESTESVGSHAFGFYYAGGEYRTVDGFILGTASAAVRSAAEREGITVFIDAPGHMCESMCPFCRCCLSENCTYFNCADKCPGHSFPITGRLSDNVTWALSEEGELFIAGVGDMPDFGYAGAPWDISRDAIRSVRIGEGITSIGAYAFADEENLESIDVAKGVTSIGNKSFYGCTSLLSAELPQGVVSVGKMAFAGCASLSKLTLAEGLVSVGDYAFYGCRSLSPFDLPNGTVSVGNAAFEGCVSAKSISVPDSVTQIGRYAIGFHYTDDRHYEPVESFTLLCGFGSAAMDYAEMHGLSAVRNDGHVCQSSCPVCSRCLNADCAYPECVSKCDGVCTMPFDNPYRDVSEDDWFYDGVRYTTLKGLFKGVSDDSFDPQGTVTRAQLVTILWRLAGSPRAERLAPFTDLTSDWYVEAISFAYERGIADGVGGGRFSPDAPVTREQAALLIMRYSAKIGGSDTHGRADLSGFADTDRISSFAIDALSWAVSYGIIGGMRSGTATVLMPQGGMTRAEAAAVFTRMLRK